MTASTSTPCPLSIQDSSSDDIAFNSSLTSIDKFSSMSSFLRSSPNISTDFFNKLVATKTHYYNTITLNSTKNLSPFIWGDFEKRELKRVCLKSRR